MLEMFVIRYTNSLPNLFWCYLEFWRNNWNCTFWFAVISTVASKNKISWVWNLIFSSNQKLCSLCIKSYNQCVKIVQIRSFLWSVFFLIRTEYGEILSIPPYSVQMRENTDQKNSVFGHFPRSEYYKNQFSCGSNL